MRAPETEGYPDADSGADSSTETVVPDSSTETVVADSSTGIVVADSSTETVGHR